MNECYICKDELHIFMTTPILELPDGRHEQCCEKCADREFPGWELDDEDETDDEHATEDEDES